MLRLFVTAWLIATVLLLVRIDAKDVWKDFEKRMCLDKVETGPCKSVYKKWAYKHNKGKCERVGYGGCGRNTNRFKSLKECMEICNPVKLVPNYGRVTPLPLNNLPLVEHIFP